MIYAHSVKDLPEHDWETLQAHSLNVANAARARAEFFGGEHAAHTLGSENMRVLVDELRNRTPDVECA